MPTPPKPYEVLKTEKKSHRTKKEMKLRQEGEASLNSKSEMKARKETKKNKIANKEFKRIKELLKKIDKDDALYENVINRYAMLSAECLEFEEKREFIYKQMDGLDKEYMEEKDEDFTLREYMELLAKMQKNIIDLDKQIQAKRKMMLDIEKENVMTIASALRSIPKKEEDKESPLMKVLRGEV